MKELSGKSLPDDWLPRLIQKVNISWEEKLRPVDGVPEILKNIRIPVCVASNGEPTHVRNSLRLTKLYDFFNENIFTASEVKAPKPEPDLFLYAADKMGFEPNECVVIEDSVTGVKAAVKMTQKLYASYCAPTLSKTSGEKPGITRKKKFAIPVSSPPGVYHKKYPIIKPNTPPNTEPSVHIKT